MRLEHWLYTLPLRLRSLFHARKMEQELDEEMQYHIDRLADEYIAKGMAAQEARLAAVRAMDGLTQNKEKCRETRHVFPIINLGRDIRIGIRGLRKAAGFSSVAVVTLALGIGANSAIFSVVNAVLLRPLPFPAPDQLVQVWETRPAEEISRNVVNAWNFLDWRENTRSFVDMAAVSQREVNLTGIGNPIAIRSAAVSPSYFSVLSVAPLIGRTFQPEDGTPGHADKVVISYALWQEQFGGEHDVLGKKLDINGSPALVIGVMPGSFSVPGSKAVLWIPLPITRAPEWGQGRFLSVVARLKPGVTLDQTRKDMERAARITADLRPNNNAKWSATCVPMLQDITGDLRLPLLVLLGAVGFLLLIACANVANLVLMRGAARQREIALREALGATRSRIVQQLLAEGLVLACSGMAGGLLLAYVALHSLLRVIPQSLALPRNEPINLDGHVVAFTVLISVLTAVLFGLTPALRLSRIRLQSALQQQSGQTTAARNRNLRNVFVVVELALSILLCMGAGLMLRSFHRLTSVNPGFQTGNVVTMRLFTSPARYGSAAKRSQYIENIVSAVRDLPGVQGAGTVHFLPLRGMISRSCFGPADKREPNPSTSPDAQFLIVSDGYFAAMQTPLLAGRDFDQRDNLGAPSVMIVNRAFVQKFLPGRTAVDQFFSVCWTVPNPVEIVGVVANARQGGLDDAPQPTIYLPNSQAAMYMASLVVRASGDPRQITDSVITAIHRVDPQQPVSGVETLQEVLNSSVSRPHFQMVLLMVFAGLALSLAAIGVYGVISYSVEQRKRELGIRIALGAQGGNMIQLVMKEVLILAALGLTAGIAVMLALSRLLSSILFETQPYDAVTLLSAGAVLLAVAICAAYLPAVRATRIDPMFTLRSE